MSISFLINISKRRVRYKGYAPVIAGIWGRGGGVGQGLSKLKNLAGYQCLWAKDEEEKEKEKMQQEERRTPTTQYEHGMQSHK